VGVAVAVCSGDGACVGDCVDAVGEALVVPPGVPVGVGLSLATGVGVGAGVRVGAGVSFGGSTPAKAASSK
jgi:hypothetical protein